MRCIGTQIWHVELVEPVVGVWQILFYLFGVVTHELRQHPVESCVADVVEIGVVKERADKFLEALAWDVCDDASDDFS